MDFNFYKPGGNRIVDQNCCALGWLISLVTK